MRIALLSDTHTDYAALQSIEAHARNHNVDAFWSCGDLVGYGGDPEQCIGWARDNLQHWVCGNHEETLRIILNIIRNEEHRLADQSFRQVYEMICDQHGQERGMAKKNLDSLAAAVQQIYEREIFDKKVRSQVFETLLLNCVLYPGKDVFDEARLLAAGKEDWVWFMEKVRSKAHRPPLFFEEDGIQLILSHGCPREFFDEYLYPWNNLPLSTRSAGAENRWKNLLDYITKHANHGQPLVVMMGHTHIPLYCRLDESTEASSDLSFLEYNSKLLLGDWATLINPGSAGHQADLDIHTSYAIIDTVARQVTYYRIDYDRSGKSKELRENFVSSNLLREYRSAPARIKDDDPDRQTKLEILQGRLSKG